MDGKAAPKSAAQRMREYRQRMSEEKKDQAKGKNKVHQMSSRSKWTSARKKIEQERTKDRVRKHRQRRAAIKQQTPTKVFNSAQALGKALSRVAKALPKSPRRKIAVVKRLVHQFGIDPTKPSTSIRNHGIGKNAEDMILSFFNSDLVSRQLPGRKDFKTVRGASGKCRVQKKLMMMTVMEAYKLFKLEHKNVKVGKSKFASLRPIHVQPVSEKDQNVCCCRYHENVEMLLDSLRKSCPGLPSLDAVVEGAGCRWDIKCYLGDCDICSDVGIFIHTLLPSELLEDAEILYYQWNTENKKAEVQSTFDAAVEELITQVAALKRHCYIAKIQLQQIKQLKSSLAENEAVLHEDYSENFIIKQQDEIMSAHWISEGVTLFTAIISKASGGTSYVVVSDALNHDKYGVYAYNAAILADANKDDEINTLHVFTDGAGSQFKNRYTLSVLLDPQSLHPNLSKMDWSFFGTAHGKGPVDGVGGTVKRTVWRRILQRRVIINSAEQFAEVARECCPNIRILFVSKNEIEKVKERLDEKWLQQPVKSIPGTQALHYAVAINVSDLQVRPISPFSGIDCDAKVVTIVEKPQISTHDEGVLALNEIPSTSAAGASAEDHFTTDDYIVVNYDGKMYPGIVEEVINGEYRVNVLHPCKGILVMIDINCMKHTKE